MTSSTDNPFGEMPRSLRKDRLKKLTISSKGKLQRGIVGCQRQCRGGKRRRRKPLRVGFEFWNSLALPPGVGKSRGLREEGVGVVGTSV
jgi:hypothetical protein